MENRTKIQEIAHEGLPQTPLRPEPCAWKRVKTAFLLVLQARSADKA